MKRKNQICSLRMFSLVELMVSMFIFLLMMGVMMRYFTAANQVWRSTAKKNEIYANARIATELIVRDLQCALYCNDWDNNKGIYPFWNVTPDGTSPPTEYENFGQMLNFIAASRIRPNSKTISDVCEIKYTVVAKGKTYGSFSEFTLIRSCVGDKDSSNNDNTRYNFSNESMKKYYDSGSDARMKTIFQDSSSGTWQKVIPYVVDLEFKCFNNVIDDDKTLQDSLEYKAPQVLTSSSDSSATGSPFPDQIKIIMSVVDKNTYQRYLKIKTTMSDTEANDFLDKNKLTFSRTVFLRKRGSY